MRPELTTIETVPCQDRKELAFGEDKGIPLVPNPWLRPNCAKCVILRKKPSDNTAQKVLLMRCCFPDELPALQIHRRLGLMFAHDRE